MDKKNTQSLLKIAKVDPYEIKENEEYMSQKQLVHFKKILEAWLKKLHEEVDKTVHNLQDEAENYADPLDRAAQEEEFSLELKARDRERKLIYKIKKTLNSIAEDDFGFCDSCGIEIGIKRLEARPTAELCIECKSISEIKEKQNRG